MGFKRKSDDFCKSVPVDWIGEGHKTSKQGLTRLAPESWKSASVLTLGVSQEVKIWLHLIGTRIQEVCELTEVVVYCLTTMFNQQNDLFRVQTISCFSLAYNFF